MTMAESNDRRGMDRIYASVDVDVGSEDGELSAVKWTEEEKQLLIREFLDATAPSDPDGKLITAHTRDVSTHGIFVPKTMNARPTPGSLR